MAAGIFIQHRYTDMERLSLQRTNHSSYLSQTLGSNTNMTRGATALLANSNTEALRL